MKSSESAKNNTSTTVTPRDRIARRHGIPINENIALLPVLSEPVVLQKLVPFIDVPRSIDARMELDNVHLDSRAQ